MRLAVFDIDVLAPGTAPLPERQSEPEAMLVLAAVTQTYYRVEILHRGHDADHVHHWCSTRMSPWVAKQVTILPTDVSWSRVPDLLVTGSPKLASEALHAGVSVFLFTTPAYPDPDMRPGSDPRLQPWSELVAEAARQERMRETDERLKDDE